MWEQGTLNVENQAISYSAKIFEEPSRYGINQGKISKLTLRNDNKIIANYDRGWDIAPTNRLARKALKMILDTRN